MFTSGTVVPSKTKIAYHFSTLVLTNNQQHTLQIEPRDEYGNPTSNSTSLSDEANYSVRVHSVRELIPFLLAIIITFFNYEILLPLCSQLHSYQVYSIGT